MKYSVNYGAWLMTFMLLVGGVMGGTLSLNMTTPTQCGHSIVKWSGDKGPYHLLLTPTVIEQHSYNVWIPTIPDGTNSYNLSINQPVGLTFVITMWGESGITAAGTTDIFTVGASTNNDASCFLTDAEILALYTFSFNISSTTDFPPQCSNMSMSWPSSLESNVTSNMRRDVAEPEFNILDTSSSSDTGNTTKPPTMFGIIPLGNSFSIPITYSRNSKFAKSLPSSSLSDTPTTRTVQGNTYLDWSIDLAKGTRFLLVAGVGSDEQWASGGSSRMITVGQGNANCVGSEQSGGGAPSVTATGTGDPAVTATATSVPDNSESGAAANGVMKTTIASVLSVVVTLAVVGLLFLCCRIRKRRRAAAESADHGTRFQGLIGGKPSQAVRTETQLDLISSRDTPRGFTGLPPILTDSPLQSPIGSETHNPFRDPRAPAYVATRDNTLTSSPTSPEGTFRAGEMVRQTSTDALLMYPAGPGHQSHRIQPLDRRPRGPLTLHEPLAGNDLEDADDVSDLKRDVLSMGQSSTPSTMPSPSTLPSATSLAQPEFQPLPPLRGAPSVHSLPAPGRRRRRPMEEEMSYMVHRDAGPARPVVELPPRYDQLNWAPDGEPETAEERERRTT